MENITVITSDTLFSFDGQPCSRYYRDEMNCVDPAERS